MAGVVRAQTALLVAALRVRWQRRAPSIAVVAFAAFQRPQTCMLQRPAQWQDTSISTSTTGFQSIVGDPTKHSSGTHQSVPAVTI